MSTASGAQRATTEERPGVIDARPVRHPLRWVGVVVIAILVAMMISSFLTNPKWDFPFMFKVMNFKPVLNGLLWGTLVGTVGAMIIGVGLGILLAVMRLSSNPVLAWVAAAYTWFFRSVPRLVLLTMLGSGVVYLYPQLHLGFPFGQQLAETLGWSNDLTFATLDMRAFSTSLIAGILGLGLSEAAYMAEIARAGILSVDKGQTEAAEALGMSSGKVMRRVVLPQAMRVIVPPTGNETIAMVKDTSLLTAVPIAIELFAQTSIVGNRTYRIMPTMMAAVAWYIIVCSVLMVGQYFLEKHFGKGFGQRAPSKRQATAKRLMGATSQH